MKKAKYKAAVNKARKIHGLRFWYRVRKGSRVDLTLLKDNERVCSAGKNKNLHILMTEK